MNIDNYDKNSEKNVKKKNSSNNNNNKVDNNNNSDNNNNKIDADGYNKIYMDSDNDDRNKKTSTNIDDLWNVKCGILLRIGTTGLVYYDFEDRMPKYCIQKIEALNYEDCEVKKRRASFQIDTRIPSVFRCNSKLFKRNKHRSNGNKLIKSSNRYFCNKRIVENLSLDYNCDNNYDRGHLLPASDFVAKKEVYCETFKYSNIFAQNSNLNQKAWRLAELLARNLVLKHNLKFDRNKINENYEYSNNDSNDNDSNCSDDNDDDDDDDNDDNNLSDNDALDQLWVYSGTGFELKSENMNYYIDNDAEYLKEEHDEYGGKKSQFNEFTCRKKRKIDYENTSIDKRRDDFKYRSDKNAESSNNNYSNSIKNNKDENYYKKKKLLLCESAIEKMQKRTSVPDFVFKILYGIKREKRYIFAFKLPNKALEINATLLIDNQINVEQLEADTGLVFPDLLKSPRNLNLANHYNCKI